MEFRVVEMNGEIMDCVKATRRAGDRRARAQSGGQGIGAAQGFPLEIAASRHRTKGAALTSILDPYRLTHIVSNRLPCGIEVKFDGEEIIITRPGMDFMMAYRKRPDRPNLVPFRRANCR